MWKTTAEAAILVKKVSSLRKLPQASHTCSTTTATFRYFCNASLKPA